MGAGEKATVGGSYSVRGGGLSLAAAIKISGVAGFIGRGVSSFQDLPLWVMILLVSTASVFISQLASNTACTATLLPIFAAIADGLGINPLLLVIPTTLAASLAFMMPVSTPPNAIVFASGEVTIAQMCKTGLWLNIVGIVLVLLLTYLVIIPVLGLG